MKRIKMKNRNTTVCKTGYIKCNKLRFWNAALILFRPGWGIIRVAFGSGENLVDEDMDQKDANGHKINDYLYITVYQNGPQEGVFSPMGEKIPEKHLSGILHRETDGGQMLFSQKSWPNGDLREMLPEAFEFMGWPKDVKGYFLLGYEGAFWDKPLPFGVRRKKDADVG